MSDYKNQSESSGTGVLENNSIELPPELNVVMYNDDYTTMEFVVDILISVFNKSQDIAQQLMTRIHEDGSAIVGTYTYDIAVSRANLAKNLARKNEFPLRVEVE